MRRTHAVAIALMLILSACGDSRSPEQAYFDRLGEIGLAQQAGTLEILPPGVAPTRTQIAAVVALREAGLAELFDLEAPVELTVGHVAFVESLRAFVAAANDFVTRTDGLTPGEFRTALHGSTDLDSLAATYTTFCVRLEGAAAGVGVDDADLSC